MLLTRLCEDLERVKSLFALLVHKTSQSLKGQQNIDYVGLMALVKAYFPPKSKVLKIISKKDTPGEVFLKLCDYWSFFDYELLALIISACCTELEEEKNKYVTAFKVYCDRKVSEAPTNFKSKASGTHYIIRVKIGKDFDNLTLTELKKLQIQLRNITKIDLRILEIEDGSIVVVFESEVNMIALSEKEKSELHEMGVLKLYTDSVYFDHDEYHCNSDPHFKDETTSETSLESNSREDNLPSETSSSKKGKFRHYNYTHA